jgi:xylulokinase
MDECILAHDLGTTGDKATLFSCSGRLIGSSFSEYPTYYPKRGWAEQDPLHYWKAFCESTRQLLERYGVKPGSISCVSFSGQMMAALPLDGRGEPLRNSIIWADLRSTGQVDAVSRRMDADRVYEITGHRLSASYSATKIMWIRDNEPDIYEKTAKFVQAKDYLAARLTGTIATDFSDASGTNLLDIRKLEWSEEMLEMTQIDRDKLPEPVEAVASIGRIAKDASRESGLAEGTPVVIGGGDGACATCGAGVVAAGESYIYLGTSTWMGLASDRPLIDPKRRTFTFGHFLKGLYMPAGTMQCGGGSFQWIKNALCGPESDAARRVGVDVYDLLSLEADEVAAGSDGLIFLPYLLGERAPLWDPDVRACFVGLSITHRKRHMIRAVLEGVAYNMKLIADAFEELGVHPSEIRMIGGGAKSGLWRSIFADITEKPIAKLNFLEEATSIGAAIAGGVGVGVFSSIRDADRIVKVVEKKPVNEENLAVYRRQYDAFRRSYENLREVFGLLATG